MKNIFNFLIFIAYVLNAQEPPNIIIINADDLGYGDIGCYGATKIKTPNIDRIAKEGRKFTDAHSASAVCSPSRYGLLTGKYPLRRNMWGPVSNTTPLTIHQNTLTVGKLLQQQGYETACIGKWHLGFGANKTNWNKKLAPGPLEVGFDYYYGIPIVKSGPPFVYAENHYVVGLDPNDPFVPNTRSVAKVFPEKNGYTKIGGAKKAHELYDDKFVGTTLRAKSIEWIENVHKENSDTPFFLYLATTNIHHPFTPAPQFEGTSEAGIYGDSVHELDWIVGGILETLDRLKLAKNTLVIFTSDNGGMLNNTGQKTWKMGHRLNGDLLGFKFGAWEGGHRIPLVARWPDHIKPNTISNQLVSQIDFLATFAAINNRKLSEEETSDSVNVLEAFTTNKKTSIRKNLIISPNSPNHIVVRTNKWSYIPNKGEGGFRGNKIGHHMLGGAAAFALTNAVNSEVENNALKKEAFSVQLYDVQKDVRQMENVASKHPNVVKELDEVLVAYKNQIGDFPQLGFIAKEHKKPVKGKKKKRKKKS